ncbi:MAG TPA: hypothetical protein DCS55_12440 [Acidimicrobiaceae bacterium]|nr:hypothetical protein [Acidimicrobiaceae bacterium]
MSRLHRAVAAALLAVVLSVAASVVWVVGLGQYLEDYCFTSVGRDIEAGSTGPHVDWPGHVRCEYGDGTTIRNRDLAPAAWTVAGLVVTGSLIGIASVWAIRVPASASAST